MGVRRQYGVTLLECLIAISMGALILAGTNHLLSIALQGYTAGVEKVEPDRPKQVMDRIVWAMEKAIPLKTLELSGEANPPIRSGLWFDRLDPVTNKKISIEYRWDPNSKTLLEKDGETGVESILLDNVESFSVTSSEDKDTEMAVVTVSLTVGNAPEQIVLVEKRRLGGAW